MTTLTFDTVVSAVAARLATISGVTVQNYDEITENIPDTPLLQVYFENADSGSGDGESDRLTFGAGVRYTRLTVLVDGYARQRSYLGEDLAAQLALIDQIDGQLSAETADAVFGVVGVRALSWNIERVTFTMGDGSSSEKYAGCRVRLTLTIF